MRYVFVSLVNCIMFFVAMFAAVNVFAVSNRTTYQAKIIKPDGYPLEAASVNFRFTLLDPTGSCIMYVENYAAVNMTSTGGLISFALGSGVRSFPASGGATTFSTMFDNSTSSFACQLPGIYNPSPTDNRKVVMQFQDVSGWQTLPAMAINSVPYAMYAAKSQDSQKLNGKADSDFVEYSSLAALNCGVGEAIQYTGASFACIPVGGGSGGITSVTTSGSVLTNTGTASAPVLAITVASMSTSGYLTSVDYAEFKTKLGASSTQILNTLGYAPVSGAAVATQIAALNLSGDVSGAISANSVVSVGGKSAAQISTSVDETLAASSSAVANVLVKRDASGNILASGISAGTANLTYADIYKPGTSFNVRLQAPTSLSANYALTLPATSGTANQILATDGAGNLIWSNPNAGSVTSVSGTAGEITSSGGSTPALGLVNVGTAGTYFKVTTDSKGRVTSGATTLILSDLPVSVLSNASNFLGDVSGTLANITVNRIKGVSVTLTSLSTNDILQYNGSDFVNRNIPTCGLNQYLTFNGTTYSCVADAGASGTITSVSVTGPLSSTAGTNPVISITRATSSTDGYLQASDFLSFENKITSSAASIAQVLGYIPAASGAISSQWTTSGTTINYTTGNVGVGTVTPNTTFEVKAGSLAGVQEVARFGYNLDSNTPGKGIRLGLNSFGTVYIGSHYASNGPQSYDLTFGTYDGGTAERMRIKGNGNVGIGTNSPVTKLSVSGGIRISMESAACAVSYAGTIRYNAGVVEYCNGTAWAAFGVEGSGITSSAASIAQVLGYVPANSAALGSLASLNFVDLSGSQASGTLNIARLPSFSGDVSSVSGSNVLTLANSGVTSGTYAKVTVNSKGLVTSSSQLSNTDITTALGYTPVSASAASKWSASGTTINYLAGNVGIGTSSPTSLLHLFSDSTAFKELKIDSARNNSGAYGISFVKSRGNAASRTQTKNADVLADINFVGWTDTGTIATDPSARIRALSDEDVTTGSNAGSIAFQTTAVASTSPVERMRISSSGDVGIGTTAPVARLDLGISPSNTTTAIFARGADNNFRMESVTGVATNSNGDLIGKFGMRYATTGVDTAGFRFYRGTTSYDGTLAIATSGTNRITVKGDGDVGIGTSNPVTKLDISGGLRISMESATCAVSYAGTLRYNSGIVEYCNGTTWSAFGVAGAGITNLNGSTSSTQTFATNTAGTSFNISSINGIHTFNIPLASAGSVTAGLLSNADYVLFKNKLTTLDLGSASATGTLAAARLPAHSGDVTSVSGSAVLTLANSGVSAATYTKVTVDAKGRVTSGGQLSTADVTTALGYAPVSAAAATQWNTSGTTINYMAGNVGVGAANPSSALTVSGTVESTNGGFKFPDGSIQSTAYVNPAVVTPASFYVIRAANQTIPGTGAMTKIIADTETYDPENSYSAGDFTAPTDGMYQFNLWVNWSSISVQAGSRIISDTSLYACASFYQGSGASYQTCSGSVYLTAGTKVSAQVWNYDGSNRTIVAFFSGYRVSSNAVVAQSVSDGDATTRIFLEKNPDEDKIRFNTNSTERMIISNNGFVGIGTSSPTATLDVAGTLKITGGSPGAGKILISDATGLASWQTPAAAVSSVTALNGSASGTQTFATNTAGTSFNISSINGIHTFNIPLASAGSVTAGLLSNADYVLFKNKLTTLDLGSASATGTLAAARLPAHSGDVTSVSGSAVLTLANSGVSAATYTKVTVDAKGRVTSGAQLSTADVTTALGYTPASASAATQWNTSGATINYLAGNVGIGTTAPRQRLEVTGVVEAASGTASKGAFAISGLSSNGVLNMGVDNPGVFYSWIQSRHASSAVYYNLSLNPEGGNVGIGTTAPTGVLHVADNSASDIRLENTAASGSAMRLLSQNGMTYLQSGVSFGAGSAADMRFTNMMGTQSWMTIQGSTGNVGIGTTAPTAKLHLAAGTSQTAGLKLTSGTLLTSPQSGTIEYDGFDFYITDGAANRRTIATATTAGTLDSVSVVSSTSNITLWPASGNSVVVSSTTASTNSTTGALIVKGGMGIAGNIYSSGTIVTSSNIQGVSVTATSGMITPYIYGSTSSGGDLRIESTTHATKGDVLIAPGGGKVGVGTITPSEEMHLVNNTNAGIFMKVENTISGTSAKSGYVMESDGAGAEISILSTNNTQTVGGVSGTDAWMLRSFSTTPVSRMILGNGGAAPIHLITGDFVRMTIGSDGNIKTGGSDVLASPGADFHIEENGNDSTALLVENSDASGTATLSVLKTTNAVTTLSVGTMGLANTNTGYGSPGDSFIYNSSGTDKNLNIVNNNASGNIKFYNGSTAAGTPRLLINGQGQIGIGTGNVTTHKVHVTHASTASTGTVAGIYIDHAHSPSMNSTASNYGLWSAVDSNGVSYSITGLYGAYGRAVHNGVGTVANQYGMSGYVQNSATGTITNARAGYNVLDNTGVGTIGTGYGSYNYVENSVNGIITTAYGAFNRVNNLSTVANTTANAYGTYSYVEANNNASANTNAYGVYIGAVEGTNKWGLYQSTSAAKNYFAGQVTMNGAPGALSLKPGSSDHVYLEFYARTATSGTRSAWLGYPTGANSDLTMTNEISGGDIHIKPTGGGNVGIGTLTPWFNMHYQNTISGTALFGVTNSDFVQGSVGSGMYLGTGAGFGNTYSRIQAMSTGNTMGAVLALNPSGGNVAIGTATANVPLDVYGTGGTPMRLRNAGGGSFWQVGPDTAGNFLVYNNAGTGMYIANGATTWTANSDRRLKNNIQRIPSSLEKLNQISGVTYWYNSDEPTAPRRVGVIAQDVQKVLPEAVSEKDGFLGVRYPDLVPLIINAIKDLYEMVMADKAEIEKLKHENKALKEYLCSKDPAAPICK